jgi:hypothetical protein
LSKPFGDLTREGVNTLFNCTSAKHGGNIDINSEVQGFIDTGVSKGITHTLNPLLGQGPDKRLVLGPFTYGHGVFMLTDEQGFFDNIEEYKKEPRLNLALVELIAESIRSDSNEIFYEAAHNYAKLSEYDAETRIWTEQPNEEDRGVELDSSSLYLLAAVHVLAIAHMLLRSANKEEASLVEIPGEGIYTIEWVDDQWAIGFTLTQ